jgi:hypothetical protein
MSASVQPRSSRSTGRLGTAWRVVVDVAGVRLVVADSGPLAPVTAGGGYLAGTDHGPLEVGVEVAALHAGPSPLSPHLEPEAADHRVCSQRSVAASDCDAAPSTTAPPRNQWSVVRRSPWTPVTIP